jgi:hypothetical protein
MLPAALAQPLEQLPLLSASLLPPPSCRPLPKGTLVLVPLVHKCRMLGCVYVLASWDVNGSISKQAFAELGELLASALFSKLVVGLRQEWFALLTEGAPDVSSASPAGGSTGGCADGRRVLRRRCLLSEGGCADSECMHYQQVQYLGCTGACARGVLEA